MSTTDNEKDLGLTQIKPESNLSQDYDETSVSRARLKVDLFILGFLVFMFLFLQFDRTNIGNALTDNFELALNITGADVNLGQTLFTLAMTLFEIPSNILIKRAGASVWLPTLMFIWGVISWCQVFLKNRSGFLAIRFLLAAAESGFIPGAAFYLGQYYTRREMGFRYSLLWAANALAGVVAGVLALGLLSLNGTHGLHGWQWLFLIEGVLTCGVAIVAFLHLPRGPLEAVKGWSLLGPRLGPKFAVLSQHEAEMLVARSQADDPTKYSQRRTSVRLSDFDVFLNPRCYFHWASALLSMVMITPMNTYAPSIIKSLGYAGYKANGMNSVGSAVSLVVSLLLSFSSDHVGERGLHVVLGFLISGVGLLWLALPETASKGVLYGGVIFTQAGMGCVQGLNAAWLSENIEERQRPIALAFYVMCIQMAGFVGTNVFKPDEAPRYRTGLLICAGCVFGAAALALVLKALYRFWPRKTEEK